MILANAELNKNKSQKEFKRGLDDFGNPLGYNDWTPTLKLTPVYNSITVGSKLFVPSALELNNIVAAAKQAAQNVYIAQQQVNSAKEDVLFQQKLIKEKEAQALIAHQKNENAQHVLRSGAQVVVLAQQKLAKLKAFAAEQQLKSSIKEAEAAQAIQKSAHHTYTEIQKAEQAAKFSHLKRNFYHIPQYQRAALSSFPITPQDTAVSSLGPWPAAPGY